jgi:hypothetical protein
MTPVKSMTLNFIMSPSFALGVLVVAPPDICERLDALPDGIDLLERFGPERQSLPHAQASQYEAPHIV